MAAFQGPLWVKNKIGTVETIANVFLASVACLLVPLLVMSRGMKGDFADDKKSEFPRIGIYAEESFRAECPRFALEGTSETRCFAIGFCKSTKQRQPSNARSAKRAVPY